MLVVVVNRTTAIWNMALVASDITAEMPLQAIRRRARLITIVRDAEWRALE